MAEQKKKVKITVKKNPSPEQKTEAVCPDCGHSNPAGSRFCSQCGCKIWIEEKVTSTSTSPKGEADVTLLSDQKISNHNDNQPKDIQISLPNLNVSSNNALGGNIGNDLGKAIMGSLFSKTDSSGAGSESTSSRKLGSSAKAYMYDRFGIPYADAIVEDLRKNIHVSFPVAYYGGSSFMEYCKARVDKTTSYPLVCIVTEVDYLLTLKRLEPYKVQLSDGTIEHRFCDLKVTYPCAIKAEISVVWNEKTVSEAEELMNSIEKLYQFDVFGEEPKHEVPVDIPGSKVSWLWGTWVPAVNNDNATNWREFLAIDPAEYYYGKEVSLSSAFVKQLQLKKEKTAFVWDVSDTEAIKSDTMLQQSLMDQSSAIISYMHNLEDVSRAIDSDYGALLDNKPIPALKIASIPYRKLKKAYNARLPIEKEVFDAGLKNIVRYYPNLYDKFASNASIESIKNDIAETIYACRNNLDTWIQLLMDLFDFPPKIVAGNATYYLKDNDADSKYDKEESYAFLKYFSSHLNRKDAYKDLHERLLDYIEYERQQVIVRKEEAEMREQRREEEYYRRMESGADSSSGDSGLGILGAVAAIETARNSRKSKKELKKQTKLMEQQAKEQREREEARIQRERDRERKREWERDRERAERYSQAMREYEAVKKANEERRRKGQPELPLPPFPTRY